MFERFIMKLFPSAKLILMLLPLATRSLLIDCPYMECDCPGYDIDCKNRNLTQVPTLSSGNFSKFHLYMDISFNNITSLDENFLFKGIKILRSRANPLNVIEDDLFVPVADSLMSLTIDYSNLTSVPTAFAALKSLEIFYFTHNKLSDSSIVLPTSLQSLYLDHNDLTSIPDSVTSLSSLSSLWAGNNRITDIDDTEYPSHMMALRVGDNQIQEVNTLKFVGNTSILFTLDLSNNPLKRIASDAFSFCPRLQTLYLSETLLTRLPMALQALSSLYKLTMEHVTNLTCTCEESALGTWYTSRVPDHIDLRGRCDRERIKDFLVKLAPQCPQLNNGTQF